MTVNKETNSKLRNGKNREKNPVKAIKEFCLECCGYSVAEVWRCTAEQCSLWCFRDGHNPYYKKTTRELTDEQREELANRLKAIREKKRNAENV